MCVCVYASLRSGQHNGVCKEGEERRRGTGVGEL